MKQYPDTRTPKKYRLHLKDVKYTVICTNYTVICIKYTVICSSRVTSQGPRIINQEDIRAEEKARNITTLSL